MQHDLSEPPPASTRPSLRRLWIVLGALLLASFSVLLFFGRDLYQTAPPIPERVMVEGTGDVIYTRDDILRGQDVWRSIGGQELGSVWGHGAYTAPDWTADWLHREARFILDTWAMDEAGEPFDALDRERRAALVERLSAALRANTHDPATGDVTVSPTRAAAIEGVTRHYVDLFTDAPALDELREHYAMPRGTVSTTARARDLTAFFFWATWACVTERPGSSLSYTHNWPPEPLVGNAPSGELVVVSVASVVLLLGGIGAVSWYFAARRREDDPAPLPEDPLAALTMTPSMRATLKYFWVVGALIVAQMLTGVIAAHYGVEGTGFYGVGLARFVPYSL
ncbi:MAG: nitric-oxide reductase large subunit, partial [Myxococcales bacterium]|nr:nitric-oxide reductase large subunit [Myxococcales bacterium]